MASGQGYPHHDPVTELAQHVEVLGFPVGDVASDDARDVGVVLLGKLVQQAIDVGVAAEQLVRVPSGGADCFDPLSGVLALTIRAIFDSAFDLNNRLS